MKNTIIILTIVLCSKSLFGQVSIGLTIGNNFCKIKQSIDYESNPALIKPDKNEFIITNGFTIGIPLEISISERLSLFTVVSYLQKGSKVETTMNTFDNNVAKSNGTTKFNYLEMPVQSKFYFLKRKINAFISVGPGFGYLINGRSKYEISTIDMEQGTTTNESFDEKINSKDIDDIGFNRLDISLAVGTGIDYKLWIGHLFLNINYNHGLSNMAKGENEITKGITQYNRGLATTIGYLIPLSKKN